MKQTLQLRVSQHLALTPQLQQSIRLLQLSTMELNQEIEQMLDDNPFLEKDTEFAEREAFGLEQADARTEEAALQMAHEIGYPLVVRPSYVLGGRAMEIVDTQAQLENYIQTAVIVSGDSPVLIDSYLRDAIEVDVDAIGDG